MSNASERRMNNLRMGIFMIVALGLAMMVILALTGGVERLRHRTNTYVASFRVVDGVGALEPGSDVRVGGLVMGRIQSVLPDYGGDVLERIDVHFALDRRVNLRTDATVVIRSALIGSGAWLEIPSVGTGAALASGGRLEGDSGGTLLATVVGPEAAEKVQSLLIRIGEAETLLGAIMGEEGADSFRETLVRAKETLGEAETFASWLSDLPDEYEQRVVPILVDVGKLADDVAERDWPAMRDATVATIDEAHGILADNREPVGTAVANVEAFSERLRGELSDRAAQLMAEAGSAVASAGEVLAQVRDDYQGWSVRAGELLASLSLAGQQAELALIEIRRNPWKVLYRPNETELEHELLYDAARSFALAAGELKAGTETARLLLDRHGETLRSDPKLLDRVMRAVEGPVERYEAAQKALFEVLLEK